jgi:hypothetical protein
MSHVKRKVLLRIYNEQKLCFYAEPYHVQLVCTWRYHPGRRSCMGDVITFADGMSKGTVFEVAFFLGIWVGLAV